MPPAITKEQLLAVSKEAAAVNAKVRPLTAAFCAAIASSLERGAPGWWGKASEAWKDRYFDRPWSALHLVITALHFEALTHDTLALELAAQLPSAGGKPTDPGAAALEYLSGPSARFFGSLGSRRPRAFNSYLSLQWLNFAQMFFQKKKPLESMPYVVVELGSAGGLGACADLYGAPPLFDSNLIEARLAIDEVVLDPRQEEAAQWLIASILPDDTGVIVPSASLIKEVRLGFESDPELVQFAACPPAMGPAFVVKNLPVDPEAGLLLVTNRLKAELPPGEHRTWVDATRALLAGWKGRALWVEFEIDDATGGPRLMLHRSRGGGTGSFEAIRFSGYGDAAMVSADAAGIHSFLTT